MELGYGKFGLGLKIWVGVENLVMESLEKR